MKKCLLIVLGLSFIFVKINCEKVLSAKQDVPNSKSSLYLSYMDFLKINLSYTAIEEPLLARQEIIKYTDGKVEKSRDAVYCLFHKSGQCVQIKNAKNKVQYFFASPQGYYLYTNKLKAPLKVSASYKVEETEIQDILKTDFQNEYKIIEESDAQLVLEKVGGKSIYKIIIFEAGIHTENSFSTAQNVKEGGYSLTFCDNKKNKVRRLVYYKGVVDGFLGFKQIDVYNLLFKKGEYMSWQTVSMQKAIVPASLFTFSKIKQLTEQMARILESKDK